MRTPLVLLFGSLLVGCVVGDPGTGGDDDGDGGGGGGVCGDAVKQGSEACDDGNTVGGDGCTATCTVELTPALAIKLDKPSIMTELRSTNMVTVTLTGSGGFGGQVTLAGSAVNDQSAPIQGWTVAFASPTVNVPVDGSVDVVATLTIPSENKGLAGMLKIDATSSLGMKSQSAPVMALNQVTLPVTMNGGLCVYSGVMGQTRVSVGTKVRMQNKGNDSMLFHSDGGGVGVPHQDTAGTGTAAGGSYERTVSAAGNAFNWYCHSPGPNPGAAVQIVPVAMQ